MRAGGTCFLASFSLVALLSACEGARRWREALAQEPTSLTAANAVLAACEKGWAWRVARQCLWAMRRQGLEPDLITHNSRWAMG